jgi:ubiquitin carboxyl-terminal hydrolase 34
LWLIELVKPPVAGDVLQIPDSTALVGQLLRLMDAGQNAFATHAVELDRFKLIWYTFAILIEGSVRDSSFWTTIKQQVQFEQLIFSLLIEEQRHNVRKGVADHINLVCSPSKQLKKAKLPASEMQEARSTAISENPSRIDILGTIWDAFVLTFPRVLDFANQSQEFFEIAHSVFSSVAEKSPRDLVFSDYLKQWSEIMLSHKTKEVCTFAPFSSFAQLIVLKVCWPRACRSPHIRLFTSSKIMPRNREFVGHKDRHFVSDQRSLLDFYFTIVNATQQSR